MARIPSRPIRLIAGDDKYLDFTVRDRHQEIVDISGIAGARFQVSRPDDVYGWVEKTLGAGVVLKTDGTDGVLRVTIEDTDTERLCGGYRYKLEIVDSGGLKTTVAQGPIYFSEDMTV